MRGDGSLFRRGNVWWVSYYRDGRKIRESLKTTDEGKAERRAKKLRDAVTAGKLPLPDERRVTVGQLLDDLLVDLELRGAASLGTVRSHLKPVREAFALRRASEMDTSDVQRYQRERLASAARPES